MLPDLLLELNSGLLALLLLQRGAKLGLGSGTRRPQIWGYLHKHVPQVVLHCLQDRSINKVRAEALKSIPGRLANKVLQKVYHASVIVLGRPRLLAGYSCYRGSGVRLYYSL